MTMLLMLSLSLLPLLSCTHGSSDPPSSDTLQVQTTLAARQKSLANDQLYRLTMVSLAIQDPSRVPHYVPVSLVMSNEINAYCDGRRIGILQGMVRFLVDDSELAAVIGHELGHCTRGHADKRRARDAERFSSMAPLWGAKQFDREEEREADLDALRFLYNAGFNIEAAITMWERKAAALPYTNQKSYFSTHPGSLERIAQAKKVVEELKSGDDSITNQSLLPVGRSSSLPAWFKRTTVHQQSKLLRWIDEGHEAFLAKHRKSVELEEARLNNARHLADRFASAALVTAAQEAIKKIEDEIVERERLIERASMNAIQRHLPRLSADHADGDPNARLSVLLDETLNAVGTVTGDGVPSTFRP